MNDNETCNEEAEIDQQKIYCLINEMFHDECRNFNNPDNISIEGLSDRQKEQIETINKLGRVGFNYKNTDNPFCPMLEWADGRRSINLSDIDIACLEELDLNKLNPGIAARIGEALWQQKKDFRAALKAIEEYIELFETTFDESTWTTCVMFATRGMILSARLGKAAVDLRTKLCHQMLQHVVDMNGNDKLFLSITLMKMLVEAEYQDDESVEGSVSDELARITKKILNEALEKSVYDIDFSKAKSADELLLSILKWQYKGNKAGYDQIVWDEQKKVSLKVECAADQMEKNDFRSIVIADSLYDTALNLRSNATVPSTEAQNSRAWSDNVRKKKEEIEKDLPKYMSVVKTKIGIDADQFNRYIDENLEGLNFQEWIIRICQFTTFYKEQEIHDKVIKGTSDFLFISLVAESSINSKGQTTVNLAPLDIADPEKDENLLKLHMYKSLGQSVSFDGALVLKNILRKLRTKYTDFSKDDLEFVVRENPIIPENRENIFLSGIYMGLKGQYYESLHILAPQMENLFRNIAKSVGGLTIAYDDKGVASAKLLSSIFELPELKDCYDNDWLFLFQGMMSEKSGLNIRNLVAHGLLEEEDSESGGSVYFICAVLKLLCYTSMECLKVLKESERLRKFSSVDPKDLIVEEKKEDG